MQQEDFLIRIIRQITRALAEAAKLRAAGKAADALQVIHASYRDDLDLDPEMLRVLPPAMVAKLAEERGVREHLDALRREEEAAHKALGR